MNRRIELTEERVAAFWAKVDRRGPDDCWHWMGERHTHGYGIYSEWADPTCRVIVTAESHARYRAKRRHLEAS